MYGIFRVWAIFVAINNHKQQHHKDRLLQVENKFGRQCYVKYNPEKDVIFSRRRFI